MAIRVFIDIASETSDELFDTFEIEIEENKNNYLTPLKTYSYALYHDSEEPLLEGEVHHHDDRSGPIQLVRRVINAIKM